MWLRIGGRYRGCMTDPTALPNFPPPADEHPLRGRMLDVINDLGTLPVIDDDGDIAITLGEPPQQLFVRCTDGDLPIFRVFGQWVIGDAAPEDDLVRLERCNDFTLQLNVAKVGIANGNLIVTADHVVTTCRTRLTVSWKRGDRSVSGVTTWSAVTMRLPLAMPTLATLSWSCLLYTSPSPRD